MAVASLRVPTNGTKFGILELVLAIYSATLLYRTPGLMTKNQ